MNRRTGQKTASQVTQSPRGRGCRCRGRGRALCRWSSSAGEFLWPERLPGTESQEGCRVCYRRLADTFCAHRRLPLTLPDVLLPRRHPALEAGLPGPQRQGGMPGVIQTSIKKCVICHISEGVRRPSWSAARLHFLLVPPLGGKTSPRYCHSPHAPPHFYPDGVPMHRDKLKSPGASGRGGGAGPARLAPGHAGWC